MGKKNAAKRNAEKALRAAKAAARKELFTLAAIAVVEAVVSALGEVLVTALAGTSFMAAASVITLVAVIGLSIASIVYCVRGYRAIMNAREVEPELSEKIVLGCALWFGSAVPSSLVTVIGNLATGNFEVVPQLIAVAIGMVCVVLAYGIYRKDLA